MKGSEIINYGNENFRLDTISIIKPMKISYLKDGDQTLFISSNKGLHFTKD